MFRRDARRDNQQTVTTAGSEFCVEARYGVCLGFAVLYFYDMLHRRSDGLQPGDAIGEGAGHHCRPSNAARRASKSDVS